VNADKAADISSVVLHSSGMFLSRVSILTTRGIDIANLSVCIVVELFDIEYYCDLEIWLRGHLPILAAYPKAYLTEIHISVAHCKIPICAPRRR